MALIKTIAQLRNQLPRLLSSLGDTALMPNIDKAQQKHILPFLGKELLEDLQDKFDALPDTALVAPYIKLLSYVQQPLAAYALLDDLAFIQTMITDSGIRTISTDKLQAAHKWEYLELKNALEDSAIIGIELLLQFLYDSKDDLPLWTGSDTYRQISDFVIKTGTDFSKQYPLYAPLYTYYALIPIIRDVEENYLASMYGRDLLAWIKTQDTIEITIPSNGLVDILKLVKKAVAFLTIKHACEHYSPRFDRNGFTILDARGGNPDDNTNTGRAEPSPYSIQQKIKVCDRDGQNYLAKSAAYFIGVANGQFSADFGDDFTTAFDTSPLKPVPDAKPYTNGNERRNIFRF